jgi:hypothetical protein
VTAEPYRVLVTGSRKTTDGDAAFVRDRLARTCSRALAAGRPVVIVHGRCPYGGVDLVAHQWAEATPGVTPEPHPADWDQHGKAAGMIRNSEMVKLGADECQAFPIPSSRGTIDCLTKAIKAGIPTHVWPLR